MSEADYTAITYDTPLAFAKTLARLNPGMVLVHVSGAHTDSTEQGKVMWARVKGKAENALMRLPFKARLQLPPGADEAGARPEEHQAELPVLLVLYPLLSLFFPALPLRDVGRP